MPAKKRTLASEVEDLQRLLEGLDGEIDLVREAGDRDRKAQGYIKSEQKRINDGVTSAHKRSADQETRVGILGSAFDAVTKKMTVLAGFFRTQQEDSAKHEQQITEHDKRITRLESTSSTNSYGSIFATWLAVVVAVVVGMLIAHNYLAERYTAFYQGRTIDIGAHPGYDAIFWAAGIIAVLATTVAAIVAASSGSSSRSSTKTSSSTKSSTAASASSADSTAVSEYVFVDTTATTPTEVTPVVRV
jgi:hypothetical protein